MAGHPLRPLIAVVGPTASGKSALALRLAEARGGEIVSCDSLQVYRGFDVGSAKAGAAERARARHHLLDVASAEEAFSAAEYARQARAALEGIAARGALPVVAGGTGLYLRALLQGLFEGPSRDAVLRRRFDGLAERFGDDGHSRVLEPVRRAVHARVREARHSNGARRAPSRIAADLRRARARIGRWPVSDGDPWNVVQDGIDRIYRKARVAWKAAAAKPTVARLHEWRKRTKDLRYTLQLLEPIWPDVVEALADEVDDLADLLGEDHDLAMLERFVRDPSLACENDDRRAVLAMIDVSRRERQARAWTLAARVYESPPRRFLRRMATYWRAWCDDTAASSDDETARLAS